MAIYAIGDVQGCFQQLLALLDCIHFNPHQDTLWFTGDLVNRGPQSLETLRFIESLGEKHIVVLGNHDLHLLAVAFGTRELHRHDTFHDVIAAPDKARLMEWLRAKPLFHFDRDLNVAMSHAGVAPCWSVEQAICLSQEVEQVLQSSFFVEFLKNMYGNQPSKWEDNLTGNERWRCITNYFTRMRFCFEDGRLDFAYKGQIANKPAELIPWFDVPERKCTDAILIFGHWAALQGKADKPNIFPIDTGCVWGNCLTALRLDDFQLFSVSCEPIASINAD